MQQPYSLFQKTVRFIKTVSNSALPIKVRRVALKGLDGCCEEKKSYFLIKINKNLPENHAIDVILHEVAHADSWGDGPVHGKNWGIAYSRLYSLWEKFHESNIA